MKNIVLILAAFFIAPSLYADDQDASAEAVRKASEAFNIAYETNDVEGYFDLYEENAMIYFYGERWTVSDYYDYWKNNMVGAGGGVEKNTTSNMQIKVSPDGNTAVISFYINNRSRSPEGEINEEKGYETGMCSFIFFKWDLLQCKIAL